MTLKSLLPGRTQHQQARAALPAAGASRAAVADTHPRPDGFETLRTRSSCSSSEASPGNDLQDGDREYLAKCFSSPGCREGHGFLSLGLAWLKKLMAMLQEESQEGKRHVCGRDVQPAACDRWSGEPREHPYSFTAPGLSGQRLAQKVRALHLSTKAASAANMPPNHHQSS